MRKIYDGKNARFIRNPFTNTTGSYVLNQAVKLSFLGPLGLARWNIEACLEIVRRCEDLYLLIDQKIERTQKIIERLEAATVTAVQSVERLDVLRGMLGEKVKKLSIAKQGRQKAETSAREHREQRLGEIGVLRRRGEVETPTKAGRGGMARNQMSVWCPYRGENDVSFC